MNQRKVLFGHAAYYSEDGNCVIPQNTSFTLYAPPGALLDKNVAEALANGESIKLGDVIAVKDDIFFLNRNLDVPKEFGNASLLNEYPKVLLAGDAMPDFFILPATRDINKNPLLPTPTDVVTVNEKTQISELLKKIQGHDIHWAACSFAKTPDENAIGYGYAYKFSPDSPFKMYYAPPKLSENEIKNNRAQRFGLTNSKPVNSTVFISVKNRNCLFHKRDMSYQDKRPGYSYNNVRGNSVARTKRGYN